MARRNHTASWIPAAGPVPRHCTSDMLLRSQLCSTPLAGAAANGLGIEHFQEIRSLGLQLHELRMNEHPTYRPAAFFYEAP